MLLGFILNTCDQLTVFSAKNEEKKPRKTKRKLETSSESVQTEDLSASDEKVVTCQDSAQLQELKDAIPTWKQFSWGTLYSNGTSNFRPPAKKTELTLVAIAFCISNFNVLLEKKMWIKKNAHPYLNSC